MQAPEVLLDKQTLERLERLAIRWQQSFSGLLGGNNVSRYAGVGHEFLDHRNFYPGDDLRSVNWRAYLRLERLFMKMFRTEPRTPVRLWIDTSESMSCGSFGGVGEPKFSYACRLAAAMCYVGLVRLETIVLQPFSSSLAESYRAFGGRHRFAPASEYLTSLSTSGPSDFDAAVRAFLSSNPASGLIVILSDFLDDQPPSRAIQNLADYGQEVQLVHLAGPADREPPWDGELELIDAESNELMRVQMDRETAAEYTRAYDEFAREIEYAALRNGGRYLHLTTDVPIEDVLYGSLMKSGAVALQ